MAAAAVVLAVAGISARVYITTPNISGAVDCVELLPIY